MRQIPPPFSAVKRARSPSCKATLRPGAQRPCGREHRKRSDNFKQGLDLLREIGNESELAKGLERYGRFKIEHGDTPGGKVVLQEALQIFQRLGMKQSEEVQKVLSAV